MRILAILLLVLSTASPALAGAWPRERGQTFLSFATTFSAPADDLGAPPDLYYSVFVERGLARNLTFGFDAGASGTGDHKALAFLRFPLMTSAERNKFAFQLGAGMTSSGGGETWLLHGGASWGRGITTPLGPGWASADMQFHYLGDSGALVTKLDATIGAGLSDRSKLMVQLQLGDYPGSAPYVRLAPSYVRSFGKRRHVEFGGQVGLAGDDRIGLKVGTWIEF